MEYYTNHKDNLHNYDETAIDGLLSIISEQFLEIERLENHKELELIIKNIILTGNINDASYIANKYMNVSFLGYASFFLLYTFHKIERKRKYNTNVCKYIDINHNKIISQLYYDLCQIDVYIYWNTNNEILRVKSSSMNRSSYTGGFGIDFIFCSDKFKMIHFFNENEYRCSRIMSDYIIELKDNLIDISGINETKLKSLKSSDLLEPLERLNLLVSQKNYNLSELSYDQIIIICKMLFILERRKPDGIYGF